MKRCRIQPAYLMTPAERTGNWLQNKIINLIGTLIGVVIFWNIVNWIGGPLVSFLQSDSTNELEVIYRSDDLIPVTIKIIGSLFIGYIGIFRMRTHNM